MGNRLEGKVALVSGGGRGIGRAVALLLAEEKASVVVNDLGCEVDGTGSSREPADGVAAEIVQKGGKAVPIYQDASTTDGGDAMVQKAVETYGRLDILVNSTGVRQDRMIFQMRPEEWDTVIRNTLKAAFVTTRYACLVMRAQRSGHIVNLTGDAGLGAIGMSNQAAASEGIIGLTRTVARDMARYGVTCNAVSAMAKTRLFAGTVEMHRQPGARSALGQQATPGAQGSPDDPSSVAILVAYLCTDGAPNANGYVFGVRGGDIFVYTNPEVERTISKRDMFTLEELEELVPRTISHDMRNWASS